MKIIQNTLKIEKKISNVSKCPQKVGSVGFPETRHFFFLPKVWPLCLKFR